MTTTVAIFIGLVLVASFKPGENSSLSASVSSQTEMSASAPQHRTPLLKRQKKARRVLVKSYYRGS
jgi:Na+/H+-dicarboxylate symporter